MDTRLADTVVTAASKGNTGKPAQLLTSAGVAPATDRTVELLRPILEDADETNLDEVAAKLDGEMAKIAVDGKAL
eukprot:4204633-Prorocentrum_lima.AAC.1